jgi:hypothetical protein
MRRIYEFEIPQELKTVCIEETAHANSIRLIVTDVNEYEPKVNIVIPRSIWNQMHEITDGYRAYQTFTYTEGPEETETNPTTPNETTQS